MKKKRKPAVELVSGEMIVFADGFIGTIINVHRMTKEERLDLRMGYHSYIAECIPRDLDFYFGEKSWVDVIDVNE